MKMISLILLFLILFNIHSSEAQQRFYQQSRPTLKMDEVRTCWRSSSLSLSEGQIKELEYLQMTFVEEASPLRRQLLSLRFELRYLTRDSNVQPKILFHLQKRISDLQGILENLSLSYQIKARYVLTREQLNRLPQDCEMGMGTGYGLRAGRRLGKAHSDRIGFAQKIIGEERIC